MPLAHDHSEPDPALKIMRELRRADQREATPGLAKLRRLVPRVRNRIEAHNSLEEFQVYRWASSLPNARSRKLSGERSERRDEQFSVAFSRETA